MSIDARTPWSLRRGLRGAILAASALLWLASLGTLTALAWQETGEVFDDALEESAYMLMAATTDLATLPLVSDDLRALLGRLFE